jgi:hypothetical protein
MGSRQSRWRLLPIAGRGRSVLALAYEEPQQIYVIIDGGGGADEMPSLDRMVFTWSSIVELPSCLGESR